MKHGCYQRPVHSSNTLRASEDTDTSTRISFFQSTVLEYTVVSTVSRYQFWIALKRIERNKQLGVLSTSLVKSRLTENTAVRSRDSCYSHSYRCLKYVYIAYQQSDVIYVIAEMHKYDSNWNRFKNHIKRIFARRQKDEEWRDHSKHG